MQLLINDALPNLPAIGERLQVKRVDKRVFAQFLKPGSVEPTPEHTTLFGHLINEADVAPADWRSSSHDSEDELSEHSDEQQADEDVESEDELSKSGDEEADSDLDAAIQRRRLESINKQRGDRQQQAIPREVEDSAQRQVQVSTASTDSASTPPSQQLYRRQRRRPQVTPDVAVTAITKAVPVIMSLPVPSVQMVMNTLILTESVTITPSITPTTTIPSTIPTTTTEHISQPYNFGHFSQGFDFNMLFSSPLHNAEASTSRNLDPNDARIATLET
ncbi:hypothetical protein L1987_57676 [Smallanthus sonchifolius]|uniref:Uncharacterized protein n=1 Tax=Smallanthus sonchifolius TaxID=185202 RepID=A0ACB9DDC6_9ASTR|nr:hypothetical protein L1987_57676 [Smallanthus sonchifolius]